MLLVELFEFGEMQRGIEKAASHKEDEHLACDDGDIAVFRDQTDCGNDKDDGAE